MANNTTYITTDISFHPGEDLAEKLHELDLAVEDFASQANVPVDILKDIIDGKASITADIALAFESTLQIPAKYWIGLQHHYDEYILTHKRLSYLERLLKLPRVAAVL